MLKHKREILELAIPNIISNITIPLLSIADLALMGHLGSDIYIGAVALGGIVFNFIYWGFSFLRMGTSGLTGQAFGRGSREECDILLKRSLSIALIIGISIILLKIPIEYISFNLINGDNSVKELAKGYFSIRVWAAPATLAIYSIMGWFIGMQNSKIPMVIALSINVINILFNTIFIFIFKMSSDGVALGTVIAQYSGLLISIYFIVKHFKVDLKNFIISEVFRKAELIKFFQLNRDIFIRTLSIITIFTFFTSQSASIDNTTLALNTLLLQFIMFFSFFMDGFAYAGEALSAKLFGAKDRAGVIEITKELFIWGLGVAIIYTFIYLIFGKNILMLLTNSVDIIDISAPFLWWIVAIPIASFAAFTWDGIYIGTTSTRGMLIGVVGSMLLVFFPVWYTTESYIGNHSLWLAMILFFLSRGVIQTLIAKREVFNRI